MSLALRLSVSVLLTFMWWNSPSQQPDVVYVRAAAAGTSTGRSWTDAVSRIPDDPPRGVTYYVAAGDYPPLTVNTPESGASRVILRRATAVEHGSDVGWRPEYASASVVIDTLRYSTKYVSTYGLSAKSSLTISPGAYRDPSLVAFLDFYDVQAKYVYILGNDIRFIGGSFGGYDACEEGPEDIVQVWDNGTSAAVGRPTASSRISFDHVVIHDGTDHGNSCAGTSKAGIHADCMQLLGGHGIAVTHSLFYNCPTSAIIGSSYRDVLEDVRIENSWFQAVQHPGTTLNFGGGSIRGSLLIRYNTILGGASFSHVGGSILVRGNIMSPGACGTAAYDHNLFTGDAICGTSAYSGAVAFAFAPLPRFLNGLVPDYSILSSDSLAIDRGAIDDYPADDIVGSRRFRNKGPDLGAYEFVGRAPQQPTGLVVLP